MQPHEEVLEFRRKTFHLVSGTAIAALLWIELIDGFLLAAATFLMMGFFLLLKEKKVHWNFLHTVLRLLEREKFIHESPGKSAIYFFIGCTVVALFFPVHIAVASILILAFGDALSCLIGHHFGKIITPLHPKKTIEGPLVAIVICTVVASLAVPLWMAFVASTIALILEIPRWTIFDWHVDDNLIIPIVAAFTLALLGA